MRKDRSSLLCLVLTVAAAVALSVLPAACGAEPDARDAKNDASSGPASRRATTPATTASAIPERADARVGPAPRWDYVALGDSLAAGVGADRGYVERYADHLREDTGARIRVTNLGVSGQTGDELLANLRGDPATRRALRGAEVVTVNIGLNDLAEAGRSYADGTCGGADNERCLREVVDRVGDDWDAITAELVALRPADGTVLRAAGLGYSPGVGGIFGPYVRATNRRIAAEAAGRGIPHVEIGLSGDDMSPDGVHPDGSGYARIAARLRSLGYEPLATEPSATEPPDPAER